MPGEQAAPPRPRRKTIGRLALPGAAGHFARLASAIDFIYRFRQEASAMQILIVLSSPDPEIKWNAVRLGNFLLNEGEDVTIFLNGPAVDLTAGDSDTFPIAAQAKLFGLSEGVLAA
jgi:uncharacterized protein involved in oxidation of intracellular sulfur